MKRPQYKAKKTKRIRAKNVVSNVVSRSFQVSPEARLPSVWNDLETMFGTTYPKWR